MPSRGAWPATFTAGLSCFLGGSAGNTLDRLRLGHVTDFIQLPNGLVMRGCSATRETRMSKEKSTSA